MNYHIIQNYQELIDMGYDEPILIQARSNKELIDFSYLNPNHDKPILISFKAILEVIIQLNKGNSLQNDLFLWAITIGYMRYRYCGNKYTSWKLIRRCTKDHICCNCGKKIHNKDTYLTKDSSNLYYPDEFCVTCFSQTLFDYGLEKLGINPYYPDDVWILDEMHSAISNSYIPNYLTDQEQLANQIEQEQLEFARKEEKKRRFIERQNQERQELMRKEEKLAKKGEEEKKRPIERQKWHILIWTYPILTLAKQEGVSNVALKKRITKLNLVFPPPGYWSKVRAGKINPTIPSLNEDKPQ
jgi:hypothetical protein